MKTLLIVFAASLLLTFCVTEITTAQIATHVVISEVYGGGGNAGSTYKNDFVELYNATASPITMTNWSLQYATAAGLFGNGEAKKTIFSGTIPAYGFFLIKEAQGSGGTTDLPTPNASGTIGMSATAGKIALASDTVTLTDPAGSNVVDFFGYGSANQFEGSNAFGTLSNTTSAERKAQALSTAASMASGGIDVANGNGWDSNDNSDDFVIQSTQIPQNTSSPPEIPPAIMNAPPVISAIARFPFVAEVSGTATITATVVDNDGIVTGVRLHVKVNGGTDDSSVTMTVVSGAQYRGIIPAGKHTSASNLVEYFVSAIDDSSKYASTRGTPQGYFVGDTRIDSLKVHAVARVTGYGARINGTINVKTNTFANGQGFIQNATGGLQMFVSGGLPVLQAGRNAKVQGSLVNFQGAYELGMPNFSFVDTSLGTSVLTPVVTTLPISESPAYAFEGKLVKINGMSTASTGTFTTATNYSYYEADLDTITVRVESNGNLNSLVGRNIPATPTDVVGILSFSNTFQRLKPRSATDFGFDPADGSGTASITPAFRFQSMTAVSETLTVIGDGSGTIAGVEVTIPSSWIWADTSLKNLIGPGFASATKQVTGAGSSGNPYVITISGAVITNASTGKIIISHLTTPVLLGMTTFILKTRGSSGSFVSIVNSPIVDIGSAFEAVTSGRWNSPTTWAGGMIPDSNDNVSMTTLGVTVTIDSPVARCNTLTMIGTGAVSNSGPVLRFENSGVRQLTIFGNLYISTTSGGLGGGGGDRGGRPQLTSNGNPSAILVIRHNLSTTVGNSSANGNSGLNMNEGTVKLVGASTDSIKNSVSFRLGDLNVGNGALLKTVVWAPTSKSTMFISSLRVQAGSSFLIGSAANVNANDIGNTGSEPSAVYLTGGIIIEPGASVVNQNASAGQSVGVINLNGSGIINNGTLDLNAGALNSSHSSEKVLSTSVYDLKIGGLSGGNPSSHQIIGGNHIGIFANITIDGGDTLELQQDVDIPLVDTMIINGTLIENNGATVIGTIEATRFVGQSVSENFGGIDLTINATGAVPGVTRVTRVTGVASSGGGNLSIHRYFDISPTINSGLNATLDFFYDGRELGGQNAVSLALWKSTDIGNTWLLQGGIVDTSLQKVRLSGINEFSRWTASDASHALNGLASQYSMNARWNMISLPLRVTNDSTKVLFPTSVSSAYTYASGYQQRDVLENGTGYWLKFPSAQSVSIHGNAIPLDTIDLVQGWNMIGSICDSIATSTIVCIPPTMVLSQPFGYTGGYAISGKIYPAKGYWIKSNIQGKIILDASAVVKNKASVIDASKYLNTLTIMDHNGNSQTLYFGEDTKGNIVPAVNEVPPLPPQGIFDARFSSQRYVETYSPRLKQSLRYPIMIQSSAYPITIQWHISDTGGNTFVLTDSEQGRLVGVQTLSSNGIMTIDDQTIREIVLVIAGQTTLPAEFALGANFPNPFNPITRFVVSLPRTAPVDIAVFDILGRKVRTLLKGELPAGYHTIEWDGMEDNRKTVASGVFLVRMISERFIAVRKITMVK